MEATPNRTHRVRWAILAVMSLSILQIVLSSSSVNIALPTLQRELGATMTELQWIVSAYIIVYGAAMLTMGALGDRIGRSLMLHAGILVFAGANIGAIFVRTAAGLIAWRAVMGLGAAMILPTTLSLLNVVFPREERGRAIGVWAGLNSIGIALGPIVGGLLVKHYHWTSVFFVNLPVAAVAFVMGLFLVPRDRDEAARRLDLPGTLLSTLAVASLTFGLVQGGQWGWGHPAVIGTISGAVVAGAVFLFWERAARSPMLDLSFFSNRRFSAGVGTLTIMSLGLVGITFTASLFMQFVRGWDPLQTGIRYLPLAVGLFLGAGSSDRLVKGSGTTRVMVAGFVGSAAACALLGFMGTDTEYWKLALAFGGLGLSLGLVATPATHAVMGGLPEASAGVGSGMNTVSRTLAGAIGVAVLGSTLSTIYARSFARGMGALQGLPDQLLAAARESLGAATAVASRLPPQAAEPLTTLAKASFMDGWRVLSLVACGTCLVGAALTAAFMPPHESAVGPRATQAPRCGARC